MNHERALGWIVVAVWAAMICSMIVGALVVGDPAPAVDP